MMAASICDFSVKWMTPVGNAMDMVVLTKSYRGLGWVHRKSLQRVRRFTVKLLDNLGIAGSYYPRPRLANDTVYWYEATWWPMAIRNVLRTCKGGEE